MRGATEDVTKAKKKYWRQDPHKSKYIRVWSD